jgi:uroporphyrinogen III methyltransferase/synthase
METQRKGKVYLVGAGPGDPGLLTLKGQACLSQADVIVYDNLANRSFLAYASDKAEQVYVGKEAGRHTLPQEAINRLIVAKALEGKEVVRLKGGDPFIFGRGGEEAQELAKAGVPFEVIPGVTSAIAVPAYAGIPLTHRDHTATVAFITGHEDPLKDQSDIAWEKVATGVGTLVFLMGVGNLGQIAETLMKFGRSPQTPVAVIERGTVAGQRTLTANLATIAGRATEEGIKPPAIIVVGEVVALRHELNWYENRPLFGKRIIVTRARQQASGFLEQLTRLGAECIEFPTIAVVPPDHWGPLDEAIEKIDRYDWLVFTSVNGVEYFLQRLSHKGRDVRDLKGIRIGAIGPKTAGAWQRRGIRPDLVPPEYRAEAVVEAFRDFSVRGMRILLPRAAQAREVLPDALQEMGAEVHVVEAYRTVRPEGDRISVAKMLERGEIHMVTFTSSSTVLNFVEMFEKEHAKLKEWMKSATVACIGPVTAKTAEEKGFRAKVVPTEYTIEGLTAAIVQFYRNSPTQREDP